MGGWPHRGGTGDADLAKITRVELVEQRSHGAGRRQRRAGRRGGLQALPMAVAAEDTRALLFCLSEERRRRTRRRAGIPGSSRCLSLGRFGSRPSSSSLRHDGGGLGPGLAAARP